METIRLTGRRSRLSLLQIDRVRKKILDRFPKLSVEFLPLDTRGDQLTDIPLQTVEGTDFFTEEIFRALEDGRADIAVHSLKDMSAGHFFGPHCFAVTEREDVRDMAIFRHDVMDKISAGLPIVIGTCSPRREKMAVEFLSHALPQLKGRVSISVRPIRGNVETRLRKLETGEYDGTILATAGLNRLLASSEDEPIVTGLLANKRKMLLPLMECTPAPCQGAIVAEAIATNTRAVAILQAINESSLFDQCVREKKLAQTFGSGCTQKFGVTHFPVSDTDVLFALGKDGQGRELNYWHGLPQHQGAWRNIFSSANHMGSFYGYQQLGGNFQPRTKAIFISNYKSIAAIDASSWAASVRIWAAGTRTWMELAQKGYWVEGSADGFGLDSIKPLLKMPVIDLAQDDFTVLTHEEAAASWRRKGWNAVATYRMEPLQPESLASLVEEADLVFWTSFGQYSQFKDRVKRTATHACPQGETSVKLREAGIDPLIFPTIQSFKQWQQSVTI